MNFLPRVRWRVVTALFVLAGNAGCYPLVSWLPDSSGFVYSAGKEARQLVHHDLRTRTTRVVVTDTGAANVCPAVSRDGTRIAVAKLDLQGDKPGKMGVVFYDFAGKVVQRSSLFDWPLPKKTRSSSKTNEKGLTLVFWSPQGNKLLVSGDPTHVGIYDIASDRMTIVESMLPLIIGHTPIRPDGQGFLAINGEQSRDEIPQIAFIDWDGHEHPVAVPAAARDTDAKQQLLERSQAGRWQGDVAIIERDSGSLRIDTTRLSCSFRRVELPAGHEDELRQEYAFPGTTVVLRVVYHGSDPRVVSSESHCRVETYDTANSQWNKTLFRAKDCWLCPAPSGKLVALVSDAGNGVRIIHLVNYRGEEVNSVAVKDD